jgi:hypothetical protein
MSVMSSLVRPTKRRALTRPWPGAVTNKDLVILRILLALALTSVAAFVAWFVANI